MDEEEECDWCRTEGPANCMYHCRGDLSQMVALCSLNNIPAMREVFRIRNEINARRYQIREECEIRDHERIIKIRNETNARPIRELEEREIRNHERIMDILKRGEDFNRGDSEEGVASETGNFDLDNPEEENTLVTNEHWREMRRRMNGPLICIIFFMVGGCCAECGYYWIAAIIVICCLVYLRPGRPGPLREFRAGQI